MNKEIIKETDEQGRPMTYWEGKNKLNDSIKLAKECGYSLPSHPMNPDHIFPSELEAFYRAAFNAGLEAAAEVCDEQAGYWYMDDDHVSEGAARDCAAAIRALKELK